jgi:hypothetical protein
VAAPETPTTAPASAAPQPATSQAAQPQAAAPAQPEPQQPAAPAAPAPAQPQAAVPASQLQAAQAQPQQTALAAAAAPAPAEAARAESPVAAQPAAAAPAQAPPSLPVAPPVVPQRTAPLHHVPRVVGTLLHVATQRGVTHARISLRPEDLGGIEVRLQSSPAGISAQLIADSPEAARLLTQAGDDLRRSLEQRDVNLLSLEVSTSGEERRGEQPGETRDPDGPQGRAGATGAEEGETAPDAPPTVLELPGGLLVDVLA